MSSTLGRKVRELRRAKGLTLDQLAQATESSKSYMWEIENKPVARPSGEKLNRIAAALGVIPEYLADEARTQPTANDVDQAFYRKFQDAPIDVKETLRRILNALDEE